MDSSNASFHLPTSLEACRIRSLPPAAYYIADFISEQEAETILRKVLRSPARRTLRLYMPTSNKDATKGRNSSQGEMETTHASSATDMALRSS